MWISFVLWWPVWILWRLYLWCLRFCANLGLRVCTCRPWVMDGASCKQTRLTDRLCGIEVAATNVDEKRILLYFHGGAHVLFSTWSHRELLGRLSGISRARVVAIDYRLAPENPYPAGLEDALTAYHWTRQQFPDASIAFGGDSAGGNLAFALLVKLAQCNLPQPIACIGLSPWLCLPQNALVWYYTSGHPTSDPLLSPALASVDLAMLFPPVLIHASAGEYLQKDALAMRDLCQRAQVPVEVKLYNNTVHAFQGFPLLFPQSSADSLARIGDFLEGRWK